MQQLLPSLHQNNKNSCAYAGNNFSWPCNCPDLCHNSRFCNALRFSSKAITVYVIALNWKCAQFTPVLQHTFRHTQNIISFQTVFLTTYTISVSAEPLSTYLTAPIEILLSTSANPASYLTWQTDHSSP